MRRALRRDVHALRQQAQQTTGAGARILGLSLSLLALHRSLQTTRVAPELGRDDIQGEN